ncbi:MAG: AAA family ATPase [Deltaproteobacteria bacterium]|nr:AAA family ATPase [Deltaproteobacteria bacterium]
MAGPRSILFGREHELAELRAALLEAEAGKAGVVLLVGEAGIGKTRLADSFVSEARDGCRVAWGRAWEAGGAPSCWPWIEALRTLARAGDDGAAAVVSELTAPSLAAEAPEQARFRLFDRVTSYLAGVPRTTVLVFDDLHAADASTLALFLFVARSLRAGRVLLVGTFRDVEARTTPTVGETLGKIAREGRYLSLARLDRAQLARWLAASDADASQLDALLEVTEGNPLFVLEMVRLASQRGAAHARARLPDGVRGVISARLAAMSPEARDFVRVGAVFGRALDLRLVASHAGVAPAAARDLTAEAIRFDVLVAEPDERARFSHILLRDVLYAELPAPRRADLHAAIGRALLGRLASEPTASLAEPLHHLFEAVPVVAPDEAITWARRAAQRAAAALAFDDACALLERALALLPPDHDAERYELLLEQAAAQIGAGATTRGLDTTLAAAALARRLDDPVRLARAALTQGAVFRFALVDPVLVAALEEALRALPASEAALRARVLGRLAAALQPAADPSGPMALAREAIALTDDQGPDTRLEVLVTASSALVYHADPIERRPLDEELVELASARGHRLAALRGLQRLIFDHLETGDVTAADATIERYQTVARETALPALCWQVPMLRSMRALMRGDYATSERLTAEADAIIARLDDWNAGLPALFQRLARLSATQRLDELAACLGPSLDALARLKEPLLTGCLRVGMLARLGRAEEARPLLMTLVPQVAGRRMACWLAEAAVALRDREIATQLLPILQPLAQRNHVWGGFTMVCEGPIAHLVARLLAVLGRRDDAERAYQDALVRVARLGAPPLLQRIERDRDADLGEPRPRSTSAAPAPPPPSFVLRRDGALWTISADHTFHLKDSRGLQILAQLVARPGVDHHVTDLVARPGDPALLEDAGDVIDARAIAAYRDRLDDLREVVSEAESHGDLARAARAREELDAIATELARGVGLGGRPRKAASSAERARINVRQRVQDAIARIAEHSPALGKHLRQTIRTGSFCRYDP